MNSYVKRLSFVAAAFVAVVVLAGPAMLHGDEWNLKTYITVNQPFQVPGAVLEPNTKYVIRRLDGNAGTNHVVRVMNADETKVLTTFMAISDLRLEPKDDTVLTFMEVASGYPKPVKSWFYPGRLDGLEFIYSKHQRAEIAQHAPGTETAQVQTAKLEETEPEATMAPAPIEEKTQTAEPEVEREKPADITPSEEPAPALATEEQATAPESSKANESLPATAGELQLLGLLGLSLVGLGKFLRSR